MSNKIDTESCKKCGLCATICPEKAIKQEESKEISFPPERINNCFKCGQCMAICPTESIHINGLSYEKDFFDLSENGFNPDNFFNLISSRRSIRKFKDKPVPRELLEKIVEAISFAPMGFPPHKVELTVVQDRKIIEESLPLMIELFEYLGDKLKKPIIRFFMKRKMSEEIFNSLTNHVWPIIKHSIPNMKETGEDIITRGAPALIIFHADRGSENHSQDVFIDLAYGLLAAHSLGLGATAIGLVPPAIEKGDKKLREMFKIPGNNEVLASMIVGYPKYKYKKGIKRNLVNVNWL